MSHTSTSMTKSQFIPQSIVESIFSRLPSKSLLRFKSGCKSWYCFISDPSFILLHSRRSSPNPKLLFDSNNSCFRVFDLERSSFKKFPCSSLRFPLRSQDYFGLTLLGSSRGLVCVAHHSSDPFELRLWNPFTRELRTIPDLGPRKLHGAWSFTRAHGFGYDPVSNDLKLVLSKSFQNTCNVFSTKSNSWKSIGCPPNLDSPRHYPLVDLRATVADGVFYWLIKKPSHRRSLEIIGFDSTKHKFLDEDIPQAALQKHYNNACLLEHEGHLCISFCRMHALEEIWMLKEHLWVCFLRVGSSCPLDLGDPFRPIYISRCSSQVIMHNKARMLRSTQTVKETEITHPSFYYIKDVVTCFETLISPNHIILN